MCFLKCVSLQVSFMVDPPFSLLVKGKRKNGGDFSWRSLLLLYWTPPPIFDSPSSSWGSLHTHAHAHANRQTHTHARTHLYTVLVRLMEETPPPSPDLRNQFDWKKPPPPGVFSMDYVPWSRAVCKRFHDEMRRSHLVVKSLIHGFSSGNHSTKKPPRGGGFPAIKLCCMNVERGMHQSWHSDTTQLIMCHVAPQRSTDGVATISRLLQIVGLFCKRAL